MMLSILQAIWQADGTFPSGSFAFSSGGRAGKADGPFPSGSFAFSYGVEGVVARRSRLDGTALAELTTTIIRQRWAACDRIALAQAFRAAGDLHAVAAIDRDVEASTFGSTMREGSRRNGGSFLASHARLGDATALRLRDAVRSGVCLGHIAVMQGAVWQAMGLDEKLTQLASAYSVASGVTAAAVRLGAIGALEGQKGLRRCRPDRW